MKFLLVYELTEDERNRAISDITRKLEANTLEHNVAKTYPLAEIVAAHEMRGAGQGDWKRGRRSLKLRYFFIPTKKSHRGGRTRMATNKLNGAQVIVDYLIQQKVPYAFGLCGHGNIRFIDALYERSTDIKTISVHHESVADSWRTYTTGCRASRSRPSRRADRARPICRSRSPTLISTRCRSWR